MNIDEFSERLAKLERQVEMLTSAVSEMDNRQSSVQGEMAELREASSTLSRWVEKLAEEANLNKPR